MKFRIFRIGLIASLATAVLVTIVHMSYMRSERLRLIDDRIRESALTLVNSDLVNLRAPEIEQAEDIISDELGPDRIGKIFVIRNEKGETVFKSQGATALEMEFPRTPQWLTIQDDKHFVRILNLQLPKIPNRTLQVGFVLDPEFLSWGNFNIHALLFTAIVIAISSLIALFLTMAVMTPFKRLIQHLRGAVSDLKELREVKTLAAETLGLIKSGKRNKNDDLLNLVEALNELFQKINWTNHLLKTWTAKLAHELKTPLTIMQLELEENPIEMSEKKHEVFSTEVDHMSQVINDFLSWVELENTPELAESPIEVEAGRMAQIIWRRLDKIAKGRVSVEVEEDFSVYCIPQHLERVLINLINNALRYSPPESPVKIMVGRFKIVIEDFGKGVPAAVIENLGRPFNRGTSRSEYRTSGLGLAIVLSIAARYQWRISFKRVNETTFTVIEFDKMKDAGLIRPEHAETDLALVPNLSR